MAVRPTACESTKSSKKYYARTSVSILVTWRTHSANKSTFKQESKQKHRIEVVHYVRYDCYNTTLSKWLVVMATKIDIKNGHHRQELMYPNDTTATTNNIRSTQLKTWTEKRGSTPSAQFRQMTGIVEAFVTIGRNRRADSLIITISTYTVDTFFTNKKSRYNDNHFVVIKRFSSCTSQTIVQCQCRTNSWRICRARLKSFFDRFSARAAWYGSKPSDTNSSTSCSLTLVSEMSTCDICGCRGGSGGRSLIGALKKIRRY